MTDEQEIIWLAGLLEGEGYFGLVLGTGRRQSFAQLRIVIQMVDKDVVEHAASVMGAPSVRWYKGATPGRKDTYRSEITGEHAASMMRSILPFMGMRRKRRIENILQRNGNQFAQERDRRTCFA